MKYVWEEKDISGGRAFVSSKSSGGYRGIIGFMSGPGITPVVCWLRDGMCMTFDSTGRLADWLTESECRPEAPIEQS